MKEKIEGKYYSCLLLSVIIVFNMHMTLYKHLGCKMFWMIPKKEVVEEKKEYWQTREEQIAKIKSDMKEIEDMWRKIEEE